MEFNKDEYYDVNDTLIKVGDRLKDAHGRKQYVWDVKYDDERGMYMSNCDDGFERIAPLKFNSSHSMVVVKNEA